MLAGTTNRSRRVLLVDGEARSSHRLAALLAQDGYDVDVARDGAEALTRLLLAPPPDTLVTELTLRVGDGASLARSARMRLPLLHVVVLTRFPNLVIASTFGEPLPVVLSKPLDYERLLAVLAGRDQTRPLLRASPRI